MSEVAEGYASPPTKGEMVHRQLKDALDAAEGFSDLVIAVFLDVRGFSSFAGMAESTEAAIFLRRIYLAVLDDYFPDATFFKPTGDGLMIIRHFDRDSVQEEVGKTLLSALRLVEDFPEISANDPMVTFSVPKLLGVGVTRGAATRLASGDLTLDYSGRPLNLAARLMDLARPSGVVFDSLLLKGLELAPELLDSFEERSVYVKGIADISPISVYVSADVTIPARNKQPLEGIPYESPLERIKFSQFAERERYIHRPPVEPVDAEAVELGVQWPKITAAGRRHATMKTQVYVKPIAVKRGARGWELSFDYSPLTSYLRKLGVKDSWDVALKLRYVTIEGPEDTEGSKGTKAVKDAQVVKSSAAPKAKSATK